ncbi:MAG TPA: indolepyruvate ferredoxin oxidoreductase subunit alpha, partial [bacterium (Candidatus Stahlbacteria)]|nr:indolepyruvate ferredoxin oxidoreductase subunit alpha [Candidatus Stahlbacteria bacterium]
MKHVGLNVAADPFFSASYIGATGGLVIVSADDPGCHSSQNEQDNRHYARAAKVPILEPSDSEEARRFTRIAFEMSERFDTPVLLRLTTRISHSRSVVILKERVEHPIPRYEKGFAKRVLLPMNARRRHRFVEERTARLQEFSESFDENRIEFQDKGIGVITDSVAYQYVKEVLPEASILKLAMVWPFPDEKVKRFAGSVGRVVVVEENDPFIENEVRRLHLSPEGKEKIPILGELNPTVVADGLKIGFGEEDSPVVEGLPPRPPVMCPGCPHLGVFNIIKKLRLIAHGDIGCYTLGALLPLNAMDTCVDMGASVGTAYGMQLVSDKKTRKRVVAVIGDSTFFHSGITPLLNTYYNSGTGTVLILDNRTTAMTGHQGHP